ncbi:MAG: F0F1 ATP synthase subunit A [Coprobacillus sp.]|nr:F0F1 ATP synthase subunit A [Coprobacillus sp.]
MLVYASEEFNERLSVFMDFDIAGEVWTSLICMVIILILTFIVGYMAKHHDPLKKTKGLLYLSEWGVTFFDRLVRDMMGPQFEGFGGYIMIIAIYLFLGFIFGMTGLPSPFTNLAVPLSLGLSTFLMIHGTSIYYKKWRYFKRYVDPNPIFLPINLISMWSPLISLTFRLFGNAVAGWVLMSIVYNALENASAAVFSFVESGLGSIWFAPFVAPALHCYFDLFCGFIQTTVFIFFSMILISQEAPEEIEEKLSLEGGR